MRISIHAPPRGATHPEHLHRAGRFDFNSRPSARGDRLRRGLPKRRTDFNSRPSARGDAAAGRQLNLKTFQFTPLREGRHDKPFWGVCEAISIHAPPRGATTSTAAGPPRHDFNSRPSARGDRACWLAADGADISIHAPPRGATAVSAVQGDVSGHFNSRPSARGDTK